jgi:AraC-like DNA-binding protein
MEMSKLPLVLQIDKSPLLLQTAFLKLVLCLIIARFNRNPNTRFLIGFLCLLIVFDLNSYLQTTGHFQWPMAILFNHSLPLGLLQGPFLYFYVRNTLNDEDSLKRRDILHFIPFLLVMLDFLPYFLLPWEEKQRICTAVASDFRMVRDYGRGFLMDHFFLALLRWFMLFGYLSYILFLLYINRPSKKTGTGVPDAQYMITFRWLTTLTVLLLGVLPSFLKLILDFHSGRVDMDATAYRSYPAFLVSVSIYVLACLSILMYPQILYGMPRETRSDRSDGKTADGQKTVSPESGRMAEIPKDDSIPDPPEPFARLAEEIRDYIMSEKPYLNQDFSVSTVSQRLKVPQHHVNYCFSNILKTGFPAFRNRLRVEHAKSLLEEGAAEKMTMEGIGRQSGFSSKVIFYTAFKKETGMSPGEYQDSLKRGVDSTP